MKRLNIGRLAVAVEGRDSDVLSDIIVALLAIICLNEDCWQKFQDNFAHLDTKDMVPTLGEQARRGLTHLEDFIR